MRIAMVSEHASPLAALGGVDAGGQNVHVAELAAQLAARGHEVTVFTRRDAPELPVQVRVDAGYVVEHVPAGPPARVPKDQLWEHIPAFSKYLSRRWSAGKYDVAHAHFWMSGIASIWAADAAGIPVVQTFHALGSVKRRHQGAQDTSPPARIRVEQHICRTASHVIATCRDEVRELLLLGLDPDRVTIVPCGVDTDIFRPSPPRLHPTSRLLVVGRLVERKGTDDVIKALPQLPGARLDIAGGSPRDLLELDPEAQRLISLARRLGVADRVDMRGAVTHGDMPGMFAEADVVVATPWYEPFGIVPLEAMACGRPIVGSAVGGLLDTVVTGCTGELVPPRQPARIATAVGKLLAEPATRARYGTEGARRVQANYSWKQVAIRTEQVLRAVTDQHAHQVLEVTR